MANQVFVRVARRTCAVATLLCIACSTEPAPTGPSGGTGQFAKVASGLKVTPPQLNFTALGANATVNATSSVPGNIDVTVSTPACVTVSARTLPRGQAQFTVTATAAGGCTLTVQDAGGNTVQVPVTVTATIVALQHETFVSGRFHNCGLSSGMAYCWGLNYYGQLGTTPTSGSQTANPTPEAVTGITFATLAAGGSHPCGLTSAGVAYCWGWNGSGQLGTTSNNGTETANPTPQAVSGNRTFAALAVGGEHTCGLTGAGIAYCWGNNDYGQLGTAPTAGAHPTPQAVGGGLSFVALSAGIIHTCGLSAAGTVYCWGQNFFGQLGRAANAGTASPNPTPEPVDGAPTFVALRGGEFHTCGRTSAGAAYCWGRNYFGQLGTTDNNGSDDANPIPQLVSGGLTFDALTAATAHTCGLSGGVTYCWGDNGFGQLGTTANSNANPSPQPVGGSFSFAALTSGGSHSCGLTSSGVAYCWGWNEFGQVGSATNAGTSAPNPTPTEVSGNLTFATP
jgi:alpha-tubulin suppressor-like RCC1 family protein